MLGGKGNANMVMLAEPPGKRMLGRLMCGRATSIKKIPFKPRGSFYVQPGLTFKNSTRCSLCVECFVWISEQTVAFAVYVIN